LLGRVPMDLRREDTFITSAGKSSKADCFELYRNTFLC
jgi:hypothetical protein